MPAQPWLRGKHDTHSMAVISIEICRDEFGRVFSAHSPQEASDQETLMSWPGGGQQEMAFAMFTEAVRREALLSVLVLMSNRPNYQKQVQEATEKELEVMRSEVRGVLHHQMTRMLNQLVDGAVEEAFNIVK